MVESLFVCKNDHEETDMQFKAQDIEKVVYECPKCESEGIKWK